MDHDPKHLQTLLEPALAAENLVYRFKPMFGGILAYVNEKPLASLSNHGIALKFAPKVAAELIAVGHPGLQYEPNQPVSKTYVLIPQKDWGDAGAMKGWISRALGV